MRLFVAIDISDSIKEHLAFLQRSLERPGLRLVHPKNIHLTLNYLGERDDIDVVLAGLRKISFSSFTLRLADIGFFPGGDDPKVVWVGLEDDPSLFSLQRSIDVLFEPQKSFKAHLTIGRVKSLPPDERLLLVRDAERLQVKPINFKVSCFKLYKSTLTPLGPVYEVLEVFKAD